MSSEMYKVWLVFFDNCGRRNFFRLSPDEVHLSMNCTERQTRFKDQKHAAVKQKASTQQADDHGDDVVSRVSSDADDTNRNARRYKHSQTQIESDHGSLEYAGTAGQLVELLKDRRLSF